jgi:hypothetical protein
MRRSAGTIRHARRASLAAFRKIAGRRQELQIPNLMQPTSRDRHVVVNLVLKPDRRVAPARTSPSLRLTNPINVRLRHAAGLRLLHPRAPNVPIRRALRTHALTALRTQFP